MPALPRDPEALSKILGYAARGVPVVEIVRRVGYSYATVGRAIREHNGMRPSNAASPGVVQEAVRRYKAGESVRQLCKSLKLSKNRLYRELREAGVKMRSQAEAISLGHMRCSPEDLRLTRMRAITLHVVDGYGLARIAKELGVSKGTVERMIRRHRIPHRVLPSWDPANDPAAADAYAETGSIRATAKAFGCSTHVLRKRLVELGMLGAPKPRPFAWTRKLEDEAIARYRATRSKAAAGWWVGCSHTAASKMLDRRRATLPPLSQCPRFAERCVGLYMLGLSQGAVARELRVQVDIVRRVLRAHKVQLRKIVPKTEQYAQLRRAGCSVASAKQQVGIKHRYAMVVDGRIK